VIHPDWIAAMPIGTPCTYHGRPGRIAGYDQCCTDHEWVFILFDDGLHRHARVTSPALIILPSAAETTFEDVESIRAAIECDPEGFADLLPDYLDAIHEW
jgi:hypothetical protein